MIINVSDTVQIRPPATKQRHTNQHSTNRDTDQRKSSECRYTRPTFFWCVSPNGPHLDMHRKVNKSIRPPSDRRVQMMHHKKNKAFQILRRVRETLRNTWVDAGPQRATIYNESGILQTVECPKRCMIGCCMNAAHKGLQTSATRFHNGLQASGAARFQDGLLQSARATDDKFHSG